MMPHHYVFHTSYWYQVATIDSFQGAEKEVIILATSITSTGQLHSNVSHVADPHRLNVALTRARKHLIVVGSSHTLLQTSPVFKAIIDKCQGNIGMSFFGNGSSLIAALDLPMSSDALADSEDVGDSDFSRFVKGHTGSEQLGGNDEGGREEEGDEQTQS
jgi:hypothetical protein